MNKTVKTAISSLALLTLFATAGCTQETITTTTASTTPKTSSAPVTTATVAPTTAGTDPTVVAPAQIAPPNATANGDAVVVFPDFVQAGAIVVDVHSDFQCPACQLYDFYFGNALKSLAAQGQIELRIHPRTIIGDALIRNDSSLRAAIGATCADTVGHFIDYHDTVFANQPKEGVGYSDADLRDNFALMAGISGDSLTRFQTCYDERATQDWVNSAELLSRNTSVPNHSQFATGITATPTFLANGFYIPLHTAVNADDSVTDAKVLQVIREAATGTVQYPLPDPAASPTDS
ncbi:MAG: DsbA family protein [Propionibacteriaceae bacterium]|nr:DsbA family protein [Propionibacteriaceae bacterium]